MGFAKRILIQRNDARILANARRGSRKPFQGKDTFRYDIFGDEQLDKLFLAMEWGQQRNVLISAFRKSAKPMIVAMKTGLRAALKHPEKSTGTLEKSIGAYAPRQRIELDVGARRFAPYAGFHAHLIEAGTDDRVYTTSKGKEHETGRVKPTFFFAKAVNQTKQEVLDRFRDDRLKAFHDYVEKYNRKRKS